MAVPNPDHLLDQAEQLIIPPPAGAPRQADIRRAVSTAYYAIFHFLLAAAADEFVGVTKRKSTLYTLVYRSINHSTLKKLCVLLSTSRVPAEVSKHFPRADLGPNLPLIASAVAELQEKRHRADYDPSQKLKISDGRRAIDTANTVIRRFGKLNAKRRKAFLTLLSFSSR